jgi:DME family drug/metabolite transporter
MLTLALSHSNTLALPLGRIVPVNVPPLQPAPPAKRIDPHLAGTFFGLLSALSYTGANAFLRSVAHCDPFWVSAMKALPTVVALAPLVAVIALRGQRLLPTPGSVIAIIAVGFLAQVGGNASFQFSLGVIGVALAVPLTLGGMIVAAAALGRVFLHEPVTLKAALALGLLFAAIVILSLGADEARRAVAETVIADSSPWRLTAGVAGACFSGLAYSILNVVLRYYMTRHGASLPATLFTVALTGTICLSTIAWLRIGSPGILATRPQDVGLMLAAGVCNTVAFVSLTRSLQLTSIVYVNALNATQATLAALAGVLIFREALSPWLALGVGLTIAGLLFLARAHRAMRAELEAATSSAQ